MDNEQFQTCLANALLTTSWELVDNQGACEIEFTQGHVVVRDNLVPYTLVFDNLKNRLTLTLFDKNDAALGVLVYDVKKLRWFGRSFQGGYIQISPISNSHVWRKIGDPRKYMRETVVKAPPVNYIDEIPIDHKVPDFDILETYPDFKDSIHTDSCIAIIACNRLEYFKQSVQALAQNSEFQDLDVFLFLDKPTDSSKFEDNQKHTDYLKTLKPGAYIVHRPCNFGVGKNTIDCRRQLFDTLNYDYVFFIEDDVVVAPNYVSTMLRLWSWVVKNDYQNNIGIIQGWQYNVSNNPDSYVDISVDNLWAYSMSRRCWNDIKDLVYEYEKEYLFSRYNERPHRTIFKWYESIPVSKTREGYPISGEKLATLRGSLSSVQSNQEGCILTVLYKKGWLRISPHVNLAENIGRSGIGKCEDYETMHYSDVKIQNIEIEGFEEAL